VLRALTDPHHHRRWRRQPDGAGAGDQQHGHEVGEGEEQGRLRAPEHPDAEAHRGDADHDRDEDAGDFVGHLLDGWLGGLRRLDQRDDLGQNRLPTHLRGLEAERPRLVERGAEDLGAGALLHQQALAREHGFIYRRRPLAHDPVHGDLLPGADDH